MVRALLIWAMLALGDAAQSESGDEDADGAIVPAAEPRPAHRTAVPELRLGGGAFTLKLNTGWVGAQHLVPGPPTDHHFAADGGLDLRQHRGRLRLGGGDQRRLRLAVQWQVAVEDDMARVHSQIDVGFFGHALILSPPDVRVRPRLDRGQPGVDVSVPIIEGRF